MESGVDAACHHARHATDNEGTFLGRNPWVARAGRLPEKPCEDAQQEDDSDQAIVRGEVEIIIVGILGVADDYWMFVLGIQPLPGANAMTQNGLLTNELDGPCP